jgi:hypothetical protein
MTVLMTMMTTLTFFHDARTDFSLFIDDVMMIDEDECVLCLERADGARDLAASSVIVLDEEGHGHERCQAVVMQLKLQLLLVFRLHSPLQLQRAAQVLW